MHPQQVADLLIFLTNFYETAFRINLNIIYQSQTEKQQVIPSTESCPRYIPPSGLLYQ